MEPLIIIALAFSAISVSRAEESLSLFVRKGGSVRLDVQGYEKLQYETLYWRFNSTAILQHSMQFKYLKFYKDYNISTEFDQKNFTLLLKNVQEKDSGLYTARIIEEGQPRDVASYRLTVQEAPPTPEVRVGLFSSAGAICKVSVNCSANDTWVSYTCDHAHCTQVANTTLSTEVKINVTATDKAIYCTSSNWVDKKTRSKSTKDICPSIPKNFIAEAVGGTVSILVIGIFIVYAIWKRRKISGGSQIQEKCNTEYASVEGPAVVLSNTSTEVTMYETVTTAKPEHHPNVSTVYDMLGPAGNPPTQPESIYATVNKGAPQPLE